MKAYIQPLLASLILLPCAAQLYARGSSKAEGKELVLFQNKVEIHEALSAFAAEYSAEHGVEIKIRTAGGGLGYQENLKAEFQSDRQPDLFVIEGLGSYNTWKSKLEPYVNQQWQQHTSLDFKVDGQTYGFPVAIEAWGMAYNKAMLDKAGIEPAELTSQEAYAAAFAKLDAMKDQLGLKAVVAMTAGPEMHWVTGLHNFNGYLAGGLPYGDTEVLDKLLSGEVETERLAQYADWVKLLFNYADRAVLLTGNYDAQVSLFATEKVAFIHQGNWIDPWLLENGIDFEMAYAPHAPVAGQHNAIFIGAPSFYALHNGSQVKQEALDFLNYLAASAKGHDYMVNKAQMIPAFTNVTLKPSAPLSASAAEWSQKPNGAYAWLQFDMPDGFGMGTLGPIYGAFAKRDIDKQGFIDQVSAKIAELK